MTNHRPYFPAFWFLLGAILASELLSLVIRPSLGLSSFQLRVVAAWRVALVLNSFFGFFGYALGIVLSRSRPDRRLSMALGILVGAASTACVQFPMFASYDLSPLAFPVLGIGFVLGIIVGILWKIKNKNIHHSQP